MDAFSIIQNFFARMRCNFCTHHLEPDGIELIRQDHEVYVVNVQCTRCTRQMGIALVGLEGSEADGISATGRLYTDPELTELEMERLANFEPIGYDDVLDAHEFFKNLDGDWRKYLPEEMPQLETASEWESEAS